MLLLVLVQILSWSYAGFLILSVLWEGIPKPKASYHMIVKQHHTYVSVGPWLSVDLWDADPEGLITRAVEYRCFCSSVGPDVGQGIVFKQSDSVLKFPHLPGSIRLAIQMAYTLLWKLGALSLTLLRLQVEAFPVQLLTTRQLRITRQYRPDQQYGISLVRECISDL